MDLLWMVLLVVLVCAEVQNVTEVKGDLDGDVTLNCSIRNKDIYWFMEIHNQFRVEIGRTFSSKAKYSPLDFETKYLIQENRLVIKNVTVEDSRIYFCGVKKDHNITVVDTFHLISDVPITPPVTGSSPVSGSSPVTSHCQSGTWQLTAVSSLCLNVVLIFAVTGLTCSYFRRNNDSRKMNNPPHFTPQDSETLENPQYDEIHLPPFRHPSECLYSVAQLPR